MGGAEKASKGVAGDMGRLLAEAMATQGYQEECFALEASHAFCERLVALGYGDAEGIASVDVPDLPGTGCEDAEALLENRLEDLSAAALFRLLFEVGVVLEPRRYEGQGNYCPTYESLDRKLAG